MLQIFQEYFKESNIRLFLKYDGERSKDIFTSMIVDSGNPDATLVKNTDDLYTTFLEQVKERNIKIPDETNKLLFETFLKMKDALINKYGPKLVFVLTIEKKEKIEYYTSIHYESVMKNSKSQCFNEVLSFLELQDLLD